jgi:hypothetical protein
VVFHVKPLKVTISFKNCELEIIIASLISSLIINRIFQLFVRAHSGDAAKTVASGTKVSLTCKFEGDEVSAYSWVLDGTAGDLKTGNDYEIPSVSYSTQTNSLTTTLVVKSISKTAKYKCKGTYKSGSKSVEAAHTITVLGKLESPVTTITQKMNYNVSLPKPKNWVD